LLPFQIQSASGFVPKTKATLGYEFQNQNQTLLLQNPKRIVWLSLKENERKEHLLNITEITYASPQNVTALYQEQIDASLERLLKK
jgi:hypothetical protein